MLKFNRKLKGSRTWDQFYITWNPDKNQEVYGVACCSVCSKLYLLYKKLVNGEEKSMGTKNMLDHLNNCVPSLCSSHAAVAGINTESSSNSSTSTVVRKVSGMKI